jgi:hypothetical protein
MASAAQRILPALQGSGLPFCLGEYTVGHMVSLAFREPGVSAGSAGTAVSYGTSLPNSSGSEGAGTGAAVGPVPMVLGVRRRVVVLVDGFLRMRLRWENVASSFARWIHLRS